MTVLFLPGLIALNEKTDFKASLAVSNKDIVPDDPDFISQVKQTDKTLPGIFFFQICSIKSV